MNKVNGSNEGMTMSSKSIDDGGAAFPCDGGADSCLYPDPGMSLRDWFAGQVLSGFMSAKPMHFNPEDDADYCYKVADALIAARKAGA